MDRVTVDQDKKIATITCKEKATVSKEAVTKAFDGSKFKVTSFEAK